MLSQRPFKLVAAAAAALAVLWLAPSPARADIVYQITLDTSAVANGTSGFLDFQFNPGGPTADPATATVSNFVGTALTYNASTPTGGASGTLPGTLSLNNSTAFNEVLQSVTFGTGSGATFLLTLGGAAINSPNPSAADGTTFGLGVLDSSFNPLYGNNDPVLRIDILAGNPNPVVTTQVNPPVTSVTRQDTAVPEPSQVALVLVGLTAVGLRGLVVRAKNRRAQKAA